MKDNTSLILQKESNDAYTVLVNGPIDENMVFKDIHLPLARQITMDFEKATVIKSFGIRELMRWQTAHRSAFFIYRNCQKMIIDQINLVEGFLPAKARVESFYVPYYSEATEEEASILFRYGIEFTDSEVKPPEEVLDSKGNKMEIDVIWQKFFRFIDEKK